MATCPNINLDSWKNLVASNGKDMAYYLWDKYAGNVPEEYYNETEPADLIPEIEELNNFALYEERETLCGRGICNYTAAKSTEMLEKAGLNPYPNPSNYGGNTLPVTVKSPLGDFLITHYVAATAINNSIYIYDMPQNEFISDEFFGQGNVPLKTFYKPRLIPLTIDSIKGNYNLDSIQAAKFIRDVLNNEGSNIAPPFKSYIRKNIKDADEYISSLEKQISSEGVMLDAYEEYKLKEESLEKLKESKIETKLNKPLTKREEDKVIAFLRNKLKLKTREYLPTKTLEFTLRNLIKSVTGLNFEYDGSKFQSDNQEYYSRENLETVLQQFKDYTESEKFIEDVWRKYENARLKLESIDKSLDKTFSYNRLLSGFFKLAYSLGIDEAISKYDKKQQYIIRTSLPSSIKTGHAGYASEKQAILMLQRSLLKEKTYTLPDAKLIDKPMEDVMKARVKAYAQFQKANTVLSYLKAVNFDASYINESIANEARRRYAYFEKIGLPQFQLEEMPASKASPETIAKVKQVLEKMGVAIKSLSEYAKGAKLDIPGGVNGLADIASKIIAIAEGKEDVALTEEMVHIATAILEQKNPGLVTEMISKIDRFAIYKRTLDEYKDNPAYQLANGKPDIRKIKKEAVDKLIAELIVYGNEGSTDFPELLQEENRSLIKKWWQKILDWLAGAYKKADIDIFEQTARQIMQGELSSEDVDLSGYDEYYQVSNAQKPIQEMIISKSKDIRKVVEKGPVDPLFMDTEEASNYYEGKQPDGTWKRITKRVTDRVKAWYKRKFPSKEFSETEKKFNEFKRKLGVKFHSYFEDIYARFYNPETGEKRTTSLKRNVKFDNRREEKVYTDLEAYFISLINKVSEDSEVAPLVFSEVIIYDEKVGEAGTIDLLIVDENGKANIIDWKFMSVYKEAKDIAWYKQGAYNIQLGRYKDMLRERYGVKEFGMIRAIPFLLNIDASKYELQGMAVGSVNVNEIKNLTLLPISEETESTEIKEMDEIVRKLNIVLKESEKDKTSTTIEYEQKRDRNNAIRTAIRWLQTGRNLQPLLEVINVMRREGDLILNDYAEKYEGKPANSKGPDFEQKALSDFSSELRNYGAFAKVFGNITDYIGKYIYNEDMEKDAKTKEDKEALKLMKDSLNKIKSEQDAIRISAIEVGKIAGEFADKFIGQRNLVKGLLSPEPIIKGLSSLFRGVADLGVASFDILEKMVTNAKDRGARDASAEVDRLMEIRKKIVAKGGDVRKYVQRIYQKDDKDKLVNKLVYKYKKDFYEQVDANAQEGKRSRKWLMENIDVEAYKKEVGEILKSKIERIRAIYEDEEEADEKILEEKKKYDITRSDFTGFSNPIIKRHPLTKWESEEYLQIKKDPELFELYNFIMEMNEKAKEMGYLPNQASTSFLPFIRKSMAESFAWDFDLSVITNMGKNLSIQAETVGYGKLNELTGELENSIPKYYTYDFTRLEDGTNDYSDVSEDIFKNMILYINHMEKYKYLSEIEDQLLLVKSIESFKGHVQTNNLGDVSTDENGNIIFLGEGEKDSEGNAKFYNDFLRALLYEQKYPLSDSDTPLPINVRNFMKKAINKVAGKEVYKEDENPSATSLMKTVDAVNTGFQLKTLGLEFISGAVNAFGSNIQIATQSGNYFKSREVLLNEMKLIGNKWKNKEEYETFSKLVDLFLPLREDPNYEKIKKAGLSPFTRGSTSDTLMMFMKYPEQHLEKSIFKTLLENTMVEDGKLVNITEFVKKKYQGRSASAAAYRAASANIKKEVKRLKEERSLYVIAKMENDKLVIPGFDTSNIEEIQKLSRLTKRVSRNALGGMSQSDINRMGLNIWTKSMMVFKNWIPKLLDTRFGEFRKVSDDFSVEIGDDGLTTGEKYDIGRIRLFAGFIHFNILKTVKELNDVLSVNDAGLLKINELYERYAADYKKRTGKDLNMSLDDFTDLIKTNLRNQVKELLMLASMVAMAMTLGFFKPDDDEDKATKNFYRFSQRVFNKFIQELSFFYNPIEFEKLLSGSIFPAIGLFSDFGRFVNHFFMEITGSEFPYTPGFSESDLTPEQVRKKAQPVKNLGKMAPGVKSLFTYGAIFDSEFAKEYDITIQKETGFR